MIENIDIFVSRCRCRPVSSKLMYTYYIDDNDIYKMCI